MDTQYQSSTKEHETKKYELTLKERELLATVKKLLSKIKLSLAMYGGYQKEAIDIFNTIIEEVDTSHTEQFMIGLNLLVQHCNTKNKMFKICSIREAIDLEDMALNTLNLKCQEKSFESMELYTQLLNQEVYKDKAA